MSEIKERLAKMLAYESAQPGLGMSPEEYWNSMLTSGNRNEYRAMAWQALRIVTEGLGDMVKELA